MAQYNNPSVNSNVYFGYQNDAAGVVGKETLPLAAPTVGQDKNLMFYLLQVVKTWVLS